MNFARNILDLPVPKVLAWSATDRNPVESEYIIMEEAKGSRLHEVWQNLELRAKRDIIREIVDVEKKMLSVSFDRVGSLYLRDSGIPGCEAATAARVSQEVHSNIGTYFSVGPAVRRELWRKERGNMHQHHGPWRSAKQYLESVAQREIDWIKAHADPKKENNNPWLYTSGQQTSPDAHISSLRKLLSAIPDIVPKDSELLSPRLWHPDFHAGNVYVDENGKISSIIDWQGACTMPLFIGANPPMLLDYSVEMMMELPDNFDELDEATKEQLRYQVAQSILIHSYESRTSSENPLMHKMMRYPQGQTLKQLEAFAGATWDNCLLPLQECLINMER
ncbi:Phosphotransferase enzyme [Arachnomyces sp. PD_36]|nr:Phosphotransferase enzyme [Arachnomyces sp. PD_36]